MPSEIIKAKKNRLGERLLAGLLVERALRAEFYAVWMHVDRAAIALRRVPPAERPPVIFAGTHPSWWDGYLTWPVNRALGGRDAYLMMDALYLQHYPFFTWIGVFGVDRADARSALESIEYITDLLKEAPNRALWILPQGTITPPDRRPLGLYPGVAHVARRLPSCAIVPVAWRMVYRLEQRAEVFIRVGAPLVLDGPARTSSRDLSRQVEVMLTAEDDRLRAELTDGDISRPLPGYMPLLRGRPSINRVWENVQSAVLRLAGRQPPGP